MLIKITSTVIELSAFGVALSVTDEMMECHLSLPVLRISDCPRYNITLPGGGRSMHGAAPFGATHQRAQ